MLSVVAWLYGRCIALRNYLYDRGVLEVHDLGARVISVGNITVGGTGKTPLVAHIASRLAEQGEKVCILTRGYGRDDDSKRVLVSDGTMVLAAADIGGDEPVELADKLLGKAIVIADADRVGAAEWARRKFGVTAFVLDDGFQHRKVERDIDIVCIDATDPFGGDKLLPAGRLRESLAGLRRADVIVMTRVEQVEDISNLRSQISDLAPNASIVESRTMLTRLEPINVAQPARENGRFYAFCGLGNPENFFQLLDVSGMSVIGRASFRDHRRYTQRDIADLESTAREAGADALVTTAKDAVKLRDLRFSLSCYVAEIDVQVTPDLHL